MKRRTLNPKRLHYIEHSSSNNEYHKHHSYTLNINRSQLHLESHNLSSLLHQQSYTSPIADRNSLAKLVKPLRIATEPPREISQKEQLYHRNASFFGNSNITRETYEALPFIASLRKNEEQFSPKKEISQYISPFSVANKPTCNSETRAYKKYQERTTKRLVEARSKWTNSSIYKGQELKNVEYFESLLRSNHTAKEENDKFNQIKEFIVQKTNSRPYVEPIQYRLEDLTCNRQRRLFSLV